MDIFNRQFKKMEEKRKKRYKWCRSKDEEFSDSSSYNMAGFNGDSDYEMPTFGVKRRETNEDGPFADDVTGEPTKNSEPVESDGGEDDSSDGGEDIGVEV